MKRLSRLLFTLAAAVSLGLCVATLVLWVRSYAVRDTVAYSGTGPITYSLDSESGGIYFGRQPPPLPSDDLIYYSYPQPGTGSRGRMGFHPVGARG